MPIPEVLDFEVRKHFAEAMKSGRYFITVTVHDPGQKKLNHYQVRKNFPLPDVVPSLEEIAKLALDEQKDNP